MKIKSRSPLKDKPLRLPGQSVAEEREELVEDAVGQPLILALFFVVLAALEWWRLYKDVRPNPIVFSAAALLAVVYAVVRIRRALPKIRNLRQALEGERAVGQFLERLREQGYQVFHDVVGATFNVDHVLIGPGGIFTIETKTWSKPIKGDARIVFDGNRLEVNGRAPDRDPIVQARAQANWVRSLLLQSTGKEFLTRPVVVFPGWFVDCSTAGTNEIWVLEPKALPSFLNHEPNRLVPEDVKLASFHLSRMIRSSEKLG